MTRASKSPLSRREFLKLASHSAAALTVWPRSICRALALPAIQKSGTIQDVEHVVILMLENRSFDHYFGTLRGVRGFGDRHPIPLKDGKCVWLQSDGEREIPPFRLNTRTTSAQKTPATPHTFDNAQAAWAQGRFGYWPKFKTPMSMGHYFREDIPFQFALAEAFTLCDAYHCSVTSGTDPNRIVFFSGSNFDPKSCARGVPSTEATAEVNNLRCFVKGLWPNPGYVYQGSAFSWPTIPDILERANISWKIYQDPNDNWTGLMNGALAFRTFREAQPGHPIYVKGMAHHSIDEFAADACEGRLPHVSWILPSMFESEHPSPSSSIQGAAFTSRVLDALTADPAVWARTALFLAFDENDGLFDHVPPPAPPSHNLDGTLAGDATLDLGGEYLLDMERKYLHPEDQVSGRLRPWGLGPRVPLYIISPWTRGGWVNSQVFDHTSVGRFLERRFAITVPAISPWHRAVCGDLTSAFDFEHPNEVGFHEVLEGRDVAAVLAGNATLRKPTVPLTREPLFQEVGVRRSCALPYDLHVAARVDVKRHRLTLDFRNRGRMGAVLHVYDRLHLDRIPRRFTIESSKALSADWKLNEDQGAYDLWVLGPNGFVRELRGVLCGDLCAHAEVELKCDAASFEIALVGSNNGRSTAKLSIRANAYRNDGPWPLTLRPGKRAAREFLLVATQGWYDFTVEGEHFERRFAGRLENGAPSTSDPAV